MKPSHWFVPLVVACVTACHDGAPVGTERSHDAITGTWRLGSRLVHFHPSGVLDDDDTNLFGGRHAWERLGGALVIEERLGESDAGSGITVAEEYRVCEEGSCVELSWDDGAVTLQLADSVIADDASTVDPLDTCALTDAGQ